MLGECESCLAKFVCPNCSPHAKDVANALRELRQRVYQLETELKELQDAYDAEPRCE